MAVVPVVPATGVDDKEVIEIYKAGFTGLTENDA
jgi:hypothetical protein